EAGRGVAVLGGEGTDTDRIAQWPDSISCAVRVFGVHRPRRRGPEQAAGAPGRRGPPAPCRGGATAPARPRDGGAGGRRPAGVFRPAEGRIATGNSQWLSEWMPCIPGGTRNDDTPVVGGGPFRARRQKCRRSVDKKPLRFNFHEPSMHAMSFRFAL